MRRFAIAVVLVSAFLAACAGPDAAPEGSEAGTWSGDVTAEGNVTTVVNDSGSVWGGEAQLVEELAIGVDIGEDEYMLGSPRNIYVADGRIYVSDSQIPAVRVYDLDGRFIHDIGSGPGQGPGEYESPTLVNGTADGTIYVYDARIQRLNAYRRDGEFIDSWTVEKESCCAWRMAVSPDGTAWMPVQDWAFESPTGDDRYGARAFTLEDGPVGEIRWRPELEFPRLTFELGGRQRNIPFSPAYVWTLGADGGVIVGTSDRYRFEVRRIDGSTLVVERTDELVPVDPREAEWRRRWTVQNMRGNYPDFDAAMDIPEHKPAYIGFAPDAYGGTWVWRTGPSRHLGGDCIDNPFDAPDAGTSRDNSCWVSDRFFDVFDPEGRYLGWVKQPDGLRRWNAQLNIYPMADVLYAIVESAEGVPMVKRFRIVPPSH